VISDFHSRVANTQANLSKKNPRVEQNLQLRLVKKLAPCRSAKKIRAAKISSLSAAVYKEAMLHRTKASKRPELPRAKILQESKTQ
jgi:hypothetical protein